MALLVLMLWMQYINKLKTRVFYSLDTNLAACQISIKTVPNGINRSNFEFGIQESNHFGFESCSDFECCSWATMFKFNIETMVNTKLPTSCIFFCLRRYLNLTVLVCREYLKGYLKKVNKIFSVVFLKGVVIRTYYTII